MGVVKPLLWDDSLLFLSLIITTQQQRLEREWWCFDQMIVLSLCSSINCRFLSLIFSFDLSLSLSLSLVVVGLLYSLSLSTTLSDNLNKSTSDDTWWRMSSFSLSHPHSLSLLEERRDSLSTMILDTPIYVLRMGITLAFPDRQEADESVDFLK